MTATIKDLDLKDVLDYYSTHTLAATAKYFKVGARRIKLLFAANNIPLRTKEEINKRKQQAIKDTCQKRYGVSNYVQSNISRQKAANQTDARYQDILPEIIDFYSAHTLHATEDNFKISRNVLIRLLTTNGVVLRSKEEDYAMSCKVKAAKYKETIRQKYLSIDKVAKTILPEQEANFIFQPSAAALRDIFLKLGDFIDNSYLEKYINLILLNLDTSKQIHKTQSHHIIPRAYYKYHRLKVNNLDNNLVNLEYKNHILAHYYLALCTVGKLQECNAVAFAMMTNYEYLLTDDEITIISNLDKYAEIHEQASILNGRIKAEDNSKRVHIHKDTVSKMIKQSELAAYLSDGWTLGRMMHKTKARKVYCVELDQTFASITAASKQLNIHVNSIGICLRKQGNHYTAGGYHWEYVN
jgi:hypothetical protein